MLLKIHPDNPDRRKIGMVVDCLRKGGLVIYPSDTVYGLGCDISNKAAMERLCRYKGIKPAKANFTIICKDLSHISEYASQLENSIFKFMRHNVPGPYTFILKGSRNISKIFWGNKKTVGIRVPDNNISREIVNELGHPIVGTSVHSNDSFLDYYTDAEIIHEELGKFVDIVVDGGPGGLLPSTIFDCTGHEPVLIREGKGEVDIRY